MRKDVRVPSEVLKPWVIVSLCALLAAITWAVFSQTLIYPFVTYDDPQYVYANPYVSAGVSLPRISWAFTHTIAGNRSIRSAAFRLLAPRQNHTCRVSKSFGAATGKPQPMASHTSSGSGKGSSVCALGLFVGGDIIYTIPKHPEHVPVIITMATE